MAEETGNQRYYRAPCPGCGAPVEFRSAQSTHAVCPYCQSTVVRQGDTLARTGKMAELFDDFSPLQLFATGRIQDKPFTLIGRLQYTYPGGRWTEWIAALDDERTAILSEDNGAYVFTRPIDPGREMPEAARFRIGSTTAINGNIIEISKIMIKNFMQELRTQRWDDHRYYHHSRINQSLHFVSAMSFLFAYVMLFIDPVVSALVGWLVSMTSRQAGHFFFEPKGYDHVNHATHEHKEDIKVGYNLQRKVVLMVIWALSPAVLYIDPTLFGMFTPWATTADFLRQVAKIWLAIGIGGLLFRTIHLFFIRDVETGLVWMTKIITDPFSDLKLYYKAPLALMKGELIDPGLEKHVKHA